MSQASPHKPGVFERIARAATHAAGSTTAFMLAIGVILVWVVTGPIFAFSDTWQLVINTGTTIVTFLMVFLIQRAQNKDSLAVHLKLNELIAAKQGASNRLVNVEDLGEEDLAVLKTHFCVLAEKAKNERSISESHSVDEAEDRHEEKVRTRGQ